MTPEENILQEMLKDGYQVKTDLDRKLLLGIWPQPEPGEDYTDSQSLENKNFPRNSNHPPSAYKDPLGASNSLLMKEMELCIAPENNSRLIDQLLLKWVFHFCK